MIMSSNIEALPEFNGQDAYIEATQTLLEQAYHIGAVVIRGSFNTKTPSRSRDQGRNIARLVSKWLPEQGVTDYEVGLPPYPSTARSGGILSMYKHTPRLSVALTEIKSLRGLQDLYITPGNTIINPRTGIIDTELIDASASKRNALDHIVSRNPADSSRRKVFNYIARLRPGDTALIIGEPALPYGSLKSYKGADYTQAIYTLHDATNNIDE